MQHRMGSGFSSTDTSEEDNVTAAKIRRIDEIILNSATDDIVEENEEEQLSELDRRAPSIDPKDFVSKYPFQNLVFEGGGVKGYSYIGAIKLLEELDLLKKIDRFAGTSMGSVVATQLAVGCTFAEIYDADIGVIHDASIFSLIPNLLYRYGLYPATALLETIGTLLERKMGNKDVTFAELYRRRKKELCIVISNVTTMEEEYCHVKTTPNLPIRLAVRMSVSIPGYFQPVHHTKNGTNCTYVDGGLLVNFPIHCYDGWWLSLKRGDEFLTRLPSLKDMAFHINRSNRFKRNKSDLHKTLGFVVYADDEDQMYRYMLENRIGTELGKLPDTPKARQFLEGQKYKASLRKEHNKVITAVERFWKVLYSHNLDKNDEICRQELENIIKDKKFSEEDRDRLFGRDCCVEDILHHLDKNDDEKIQYHELVNFIQETGINIQSRYHGYKRQRFDSLASFFATVNYTVACNIERIFQNETDAERTVGINTGHINTTDFDLLKEDRDFLIEQGYKSTKAYLQYFAAKFELEKEGQLEENTKHAMNSTMGSTTNRKRKKTSM